MHTLLVRRGKPHIGQIIFKTNDDILIQYSVINHGAPENCVDVFCTAIATVFFSVADLKLN